MAKASADSSAMIDVAVQSVCVSCAEAGTLHAIMKRESGDSIVAVCKLLPRLSGSAETRSGGCFSCAVLYCAVLYCTILRCAVLC